MKLVLFDDYRLGVLKDGQVKDAMGAFPGATFRRPQDMMEEVITSWDQLKPKIESAISGADGVPVSSVKLRAPLPRPSKIICAAVNYLEFGQRKPAILDAFLKSPSGVNGGAIMYRKGGEIKAAMAV